ncbi:MAG TPA: ABC transporter substrate-binding protein [Stellaceae bacterium]|nr:ABC transporter substrate-binding protein [Stellaceae bacterium]
MSRAGLTVVVAASVAFAAGLARADDPLRIGFVATLSSPTSTAGPDMLDSFKLGLSELGGKLGGRAVDLKVSDDEMKPDVGVQKVRKMLDEDKVQLFTGMVLSNVALAEARTVLPRKTFMLSLNAGPSPLAGPECSPYFFSAAYQSDTIAEGMSIYLQQKGVKSVSLMAPNYTAGRDLLTGFKRYFKNTIASETYTPLDQFDFVAELAEIRSANPAATFFFYTSGAPAINFVKQYAETGLKGKIPLYGVAFSLDEQTLPGMGEAAVGVHDSTFWTADMDNAANHAFVAHFEAAYHRRPSIFAAISYDGVRLLDAALKAVGGRIENADAFRAALETAKIASVRGRFRFNSNHFPIQDIHLAEVVRDASGALTNSYRERIVQDHADSYVGQCKMP